MNTATIVVFIVFLLCVAAALFALIRKRLRATGTGACECGCSSCPSMRRAYANAQSFQAPLADAAASGVDEGEA